MGLDLGSGYPSDPKTKSAVQELVKGERPHDCLRWSWKTVSDAWAEHRHHVQMHANEPCFE